MSPIGDGFEEKLLKQRGGNYGVVDGGVLSGSTNDSIEEVCNYLFATLVTTAGIDSLTEVEEEKSSPQLQKQIYDQLRAAQIVGRASHVPSPVIKNVEVFGRFRPYRMAFAQKNGVMRVMEVFDFSNAKPKQLEHHAAWAKVAFDDIMGAYGNAEPVAVFSRSSKASRKAVEEKCMDLLSQSANLVDWNSEEERNDLVLRCKVSAGVLETSSVPLREFKVNSSYMQRSISSIFDSSASPGSESMIDLFEGITKGVINPKMIGMTFDEIEKLKQRLANKGASNKPSTPRLPGLDS
ncbi:hypothetical protein SH501x_000886 [Pirellulaceae bacterium SH501]